MLFSKISEDIKNAMRAKNAELLLTLRGLSSSLKNEAINLKKTELDDAEVIKVIKTEVKRRKDSIEAYQQGGREDLAEVEIKEKAILESYLPAQMSEEDTEKKIVEILSTIPEDQKTNFGAVMGRVMKDVGENADGTMVRTILQKLLAK